MSQCKEGFSRQDGAVPELSYRSKFSLPLINFASHCLHIKTYAGRGTIIQSRQDESEYNKDVSSIAFWKQVKKIHTQLGQDKMSSDETESEQHNLQAKIVCCIPKIWVNAAISEFWNAIEKHGKGSLSRVGNSPYTCIFELRFANITLQVMPTQRRLCIPGLPLAFPQTTTVTYGGRDFWQHYVSCSYYYLLHG